MNELNIKDKILTKPANTISRISSLRCLMRHIEFIYSDNTSVISQLLLSFA